MTTLLLETDPLATHAEVSDEQLTVHLADGRVVSVPLAWFPGLLHGSAEERANWCLLGEGDAIEWVDLDEHIGIDELLAGRRSGESDESLSRWLASRKQPPP